MIKFILIGDRHNSEHKPINRIDDYFESTKLKDEEIIELAISEKVDAVMHAGDFWTDGDKKMKKEFVSSIVNRWKPLKENNIPLIGIAGNHDIFGNNIKSLPNTTIGFLNDIGIFKLVSKENPMTFEDDEVSVKITGSNYHHNVDKPEYLSDYIVDSKSTDYHIHIVHGMLSDKSMGKYIRHTTVDQIKSTCADLTFCGHDHIGFNTIEIDGKYFTNPGAIVRVKNDKKELSRKIKVILVEIDKNGIKLKDIYLKSAKDSSLVLSREVVEKKKEKELAAEELKSKIKQLGLQKKVKFEDILEQVYENKDVSDEIKIDIQKRLNQKIVENEFSGVLPINNEIESITLVNFMSYIDTTIDFSKGFNVILGESRQGKTTILRALRWVYENKPSGKSMIRHGEDYSSVSIKLKNQNIIKREIGKNINGYKVFKPDGSVLEGNTKMIGEVQELLGFRDMKIDSKLSLPINFMRQGQGWYLIGDSISSTDRARILGSLRNTNSCDAVNKDLERESHKAQKNIEANHKVIELTIKDIEEVAKLKRDKEKLREILILEKQIIEINNYYENLEKYNKDKELLKEFNNFDENKIVNYISELKDELSKLTIVNEEMLIFKKETENIKNNNFIIKDLNKFIKTESSIFEINNLINSYIDIKENIYNISKEKNKQLKIKEVLKSLKIEKIEDNILNLKENVNYYEEISSINENYQKELKKLNKLKSLILEMKNVDDLILKQEELKQILKKEEEIKEILSEFYKHSEIIKSKKDETNKLNEKIEKIIEDKILLLKKNKLCPTCFGSIDQETIKTISIESKK